MSIRRISPDRKAPLAAPHGFVPSPSCTGSRRPTTHGSRRAWPGNSTGGGGGRQIPVPTDRRYRVSPSPPAGRQAADRSLGCDGDGATLLTAGWQAASGAGCAGALCCASAGSARASPAAAMSSGLAAHWRLRAHVRLRWWWSATSSRLRRKEEERADDQHEDDDQNCNSRHGVPLCLLCEDGLLPELGHRCIALAVTAIVQASRPPGRARRPDGRRQIDRRPAAREAARACLRRQRFGDRGRRRPSGGRTVRTLWRGGFPRRRAAAGCAPGRRRGAGDRDRRRRLRRSAHPRAAQRRAITVWLDAPVDVLAERTSRRDTRAAAAATATPRGRWSGSRRASGRPTPKRIST